MRCNFRLFQDPDKFCFGIDAVLLADFAKAKDGEKVCDLCSGTGVVPLLMLGRYPGTTYTGVEIQPDLADMACRSMKFNHVEDKVSVLCTDLRNRSSIAGPESFDVVTANPPYLKKSERSRKNESETVRLARHELTCTLQDVCRTAAYLLRFHGRFYLVHLPSRLAEIMEELRRAGLEPKTMQLVYPFTDKGPEQVLLMAMKGAGEGLEVLPPLVTYEKPGVYTPEMLEVYGIHGDRTDLPKL